MAKIDTSEYQSFDQITARLDSIVDQVRDKNVSLEHSLDLFDEAIALGSKAVNMVDTTEFTPEEEERLFRLRLQEMQLTQRAPQKLPRLLLMSRLLMSRLRLQPQMKRRLMMQFQKAMSTSGSTCFSPKA